MNNTIWYIKNIFIRNNLGYREGNMMNYFVSFMSDYFVITYLLVLVLLIFGASLLLRVKKTDEVIEELNPYELAFLRQGTKAVIEVVLFSFIEKGKLSINGGKIRVLEEMVAENEVEKVVLEKINTLKTVDSIMKSKELKNEVKLALKENLEKLEKYNFIEDESQRAKRKEVFIGSAAILSLIIVITIIFRSINNEPMFMVGLGLVLSAIIFIRGLLGTDVEKTNIGYEYLINRIKLEKKRSKETPNMDKGRRISFCGMVGTRYFMEEQILNNFDDWGYGPFYAWIFTK